MVLNLSQQCTEVPASINCSVLISLGSGFLYRQETCFAGFKITVFLLLLENMKSKVPLILYLEVRERFTEKWKIRSEMVLLSSGNPIPAVRLDLSKKPVVFCAEEFYLFRGKSLERTGTSWVNCLNTAWVSCHRADEPCKGPLVLGLSVKGGGAEQLSKCGLHRDTVNVAGAWSPEREPSRRKGSRSVHPPKSQHQELWGHPGWKWQTGYLDC